MDTTQQPWQQQRPNVFYKPLANDVERNIQFDLMQLPPNTSYSKHSHPQFEWAYVLKGSLSDERGTFSVGHFFTNETGSIHTPTSGPDGTELLIVWCGEVKPVTE